RLAAADRSAGASAQACCAERCAIRERGRWFSGLPEISRSLLERERFPTTSCAASRRRDMFTRREVAAGGMLTLLFGGCCRADSARTPHTFGCCLASEDVEAVYPNGTDTRTYFTGNEPMIPRSGDRDFDFALAQTLAKISDAFGVLPGFAYYDDYDSRNA